MSPHSFTQNFRDLSNDSGFQFEFFCDRCRSGHRSGFRTHKLGIATAVLKGISALLGGAMARATSGADQVKDALRGSAHDTAYRHAVEECKLELRHCTKCGRWVCKDACWNDAGHVCQSCTPA